MNDETCITWHKSTGKFGVDMGFMSKIEATELYKQLQDISISRDEAVALICNSDLDEIEKVVVAVNIGEWNWISYNGVHFRIVFYDQMNTINL